MKRNLLLSFVSWTCSQVYGFPFGNQSPEVIWDTTRCSNINPIVDSKTIILIAKGKWPGSCAGEQGCDQLCHSIRRDLKVNDDSAYTMSVDLNVLSGFGSGLEVGFPGFAFNYWDDSNYDFVFKKFDANQPNLAIGSIRNGVMNRQPDIPNNPQVQLRQWYNFEIEVSPNKEVTVKLDNQVLGSFNAFFTTRGYGGVVAANGFNSVIQFRNFDVAPKV